MREIFSNILAHRDYSTGYVAKFVIEKDRMYTENGNLANEAILDMQGITETVSRYYSSNGDMSV